MAKLLPHREEIIPIKSETYVPPKIPQEEPAAAAPAYVPPVRTRPRDADAQPQTPPSDRHCSRCGQSTTFYYDLFQLKASHVDGDQLARLGMDLHPWVLGVFCGQCRTYVSILPAPAKQAPTLPFTHG